MVVIPPTIKVKFLFCSNLKENRKSSPPFEIYAYACMYVQVKTDFWADIVTTPYPQLNS